MGLRPIPPPPRIVQHIQMWRIYFNPWPGRAASPPRMRCPGTTGRISNRSGAGYIRAGARSAWGATKLRIHNSFIWPYLHIFSVLSRAPHPLLGILHTTHLPQAWPRKKARRDWHLAFVANILSIHSALPGYPVLGLLLPRHSSNSSHVIAENETNFCNLIAFRVDGVSSTHREKKL